jgi:4-aminobutyrate aminotransferase/(S)-3-amino-2-methylpropionate transaminase
MIAVELADAARAAAVAARCHEAGLLVLTCGTYGNVLRFLPPLVISDDDLRRGLDIVRNSLLLP